MPNLWEEIHGLLEVKQTAFNALKQYITYQVTSQWMDWKFNGRLT